MNKRSTKTVSAKPRVQSSRSQRGAVELAPRAVFLIGFMGAGKSSVGRALAARLNWAFEDLDDRIERRERRSVAQIFRESGEAAFRRAEHSALQDLLDGIGEQSRIVALGGGAYVQTRNAALLTSASVPIIFLDAAVEVLWERCCKQASEAGAERPLLRDPNQFRQLYESRRLSYADAPHTIHTDNLTVEEIATEIERTLDLKKLANLVEQGETE
ncbi:MAG TPA: shikimate kinase [Candidatus Sulfotelmatobacter sp.]|nr:shikimate kinase [Candidatus Sulfotelmatobacter sp.]